MFILSSQLLANNITGCKTNVIFLVTVNYAGGSLACSWLADTALLTFTDY